MLNRKGLFVFIIFTFFICLAFFHKVPLPLFSNSTTQQTEQLQDATQSSTYKTTADNEQVLQANGCDLYQQVLKQDKFRKGFFISSKAILWYFEGYSKESIAEALAAQYGLDLAFKWLENIQGLSRYHENHSELVQTIEALEFNHDFESAYWQLTVLKKYFPAPDTERLDINERINLYPDLAEYHWLSDFNSAIRNKDTQGALNAIAALKDNGISSRFFLHPLSNYLTLYELSSFDANAAKTIISNLFELSPVLLTSNARAERRIKSSLSKLEIDTAIWQFEYEADLNLTVDPEIQALIDELYFTESSLAALPDQQKICEQSQQNTANVDTEVIRFSPEYKNNQLSQPWRSVAKLQCAMGDFLTDVIAITKKLNELGIDMDKLHSHEDKLAQAPQLAQAIASMNGQESSSLFNLLYLNGTKTTEQVRNLMNAQIAPTNSDFYKVIRRLPLTEQKALLLEQQHQLSTENGRGFTLVFNAIVYSENEDEIVPFLVEQGFPLKAHIDSPDPLWALLEKLSNQPEGLRIPIATLDALTSNTSLNETHANAMYKIKRRNEALYHRIITEVSDLEMDTPLKLIEIECTN